MPRWPAIVAPLAIGAAFAYWVPLDRLYEVLQPLITFLSIMAAAVLVRLNRTMPSLEWKTLDDDQRKKLTSEVVKLAEEYLGFLAITGVLVIFLLALLVVGHQTIFGTASGAPDPKSGWYGHWCRLDAGLIGAGTSFLSLRMAYIAWRDLDIVRLQKQIIDLAASKAHQAEQLKIAEEKRARMAAAGLRTEPNDPPRAWS